MSSFRIKENSHTLAPAVMALESLGFTVSVQRRRTQGPLWHAESTALELVANNPLELLGLVKLHEVRGENWSASAEESQAVLLRHKGELATEPSREARQQDEPLPGDR